MINSFNLFPLTKNLSILLVEDYEQIRSSVKELLGNYFYIVNCAKDGIDGINEYVKFYQESGKYYDIVLTDIKMPNLNGIDMIKEIKKINKKQKIAVLSAHDESEYLVSLINIGVNQFIQKPIQNKEMLKSFYIIAKEIESDSYQTLLNLSQEYQYNIDKKILIYKNKEINLTKFESLLLEALANQYKNICTTKQILSHFHDNNIDLTADNIRFLIAKLRKKLPKNCIKTIYSVGYKLQNTNQLVEEKV